MPYLELSNSREIKVDVKIPLMKTFLRPDTVREQPGALTQCGLLSWGWGSS